MVDSIRQIRENPDTRYGYHKMCVALVMLGYLINAKKVYRLMRQEGILRSPYRRSSKAFVKYATVRPERPLQVLEMDIKQQWIGHDRRHVYILSIIDTFTRVVLHRDYGFHMTHQQVRKAWERVITEYLQPADLLRQDLHVELRTDNGPQFIAEELRLFFQQNFIGHVFIHPYTPQENGHIESFHSILSEALNLQAFWTFHDLEVFLERFYETYNNVRLHGSIANLPPMTFWKQWEQGNIDRSSHRIWRVTPVFFISLLM